MHVHEAIHKVDPVDTALHWSTKIKRRRYSVPSPNSLWHLGIEFCDCIVYIMLLELPIGLCGSCTNKIGHVQWPYTQVL